MMIFREHLVRGMYARSFVFGISFFSMSSFGTLQRWKYFKSAI